MQIRPDRLGSDDQLLEMVLCPTFSLQTVADTNDMTLTQLARWAAKDDVKESLRAMREIHRARAAVIATEAMTTALAALEAMVKAHEHEERSELAPQSPEGLAARARTRETIRKACHQLLRAAATHLRPRRRRTRPEPAAQHHTPPTPTIAPPTPPNIRATTPPAPHTTPPQPVTALTLERSPLNPKPTATTHLAAAAGACAPPIGTS